MSLFGNKQGTFIPRFTSLSWQTSSTALPIPILYGKTLLSPNVIWSNGFGSYKGTQPGMQTGGGKGGLFGGNQDSYVYYTGFMFGLCEGPVKNLWNNSAVGVMYNNGSLSSLNNINGFCFPGTWPQALWTDNNYNYQMLNYPGIAYIATNFFPLGSSNTPPSLNVEILGLLDPSTVNSYQNIQTLNVNGGAQGGEIDPATIIFDFLTNPQYGVLFPSGYIDQTTLFSSVTPGQTVNGIKGPILNDSTYQTYCYASYLGMSPLLQDQEAANSILARWLKLTNTAAVWSGGKLKFIPYGDTTLTGTNPFSNFNFNWVPYQPVSGYQIEDDDYIHTQDEDPIKCQRNDPFQIHNIITLEYLNRGSGGSGAAYQATPVSAFDQNFINLYGLRTGSSITAHEICDIGIASVSAQLILQRELYIRNTYSFKLSIEYCLLDPMDIIQISDPILFGAGVFVNVRITSIEEDDDGILNIEAEEYPGGIGIAQKYNKQNSQQTTLINRNIAPQQINSPIIFEPPSSLTSNTIQLWASVSASIPPVQLITQDTSNTLHQLSWNGEPNTTSSEIAAFSIQIAMPSTNFVNCVSLTGADSTYRSKVDYLLNELECIIDTSYTVPNTFSISSQTYGSITYFTLLLVINITATCTPNFTLNLSNGTSSPLPISFTGNGLNGIYYWQPQTTSVLASTTEPITNLLTNIPNTVTPIATGLTSGSPSPQSGILTPIGTSGQADPNWGGCNVWVSIDTVNYSNFGYIIGQCRMGNILSSGTSMPALSGLDTTSTLAVDLTESAGYLASINNNSSATTASTLCIAITPAGAYELFAYGNSNLSSTYKYNLSYFERGLYGTTPLNVNNSDSFARLDSNTFQYTLPSQYVGIPLYFKFQSFNIYGNGYQDLAECVQYTFTPTGISSVISEFSATNTSSQSLTAANIYYIVAAQNALANTGSNYNTSTYKFTAPVNGNYLFGGSLNLSGLSSSASANLLFQLNGTNLTYAVASVIGTGASSTSISTTTILALTAGQTVNLAIQASITGVAIINNSVSFWGNLIS